MLSVIIATQDSERALVPTLSALVSGAVAGLVREVIVADGGSRDATARVADSAGCRIAVTEAPLGARLRAAAESARGPWLMFLRPGTVPEPAWVDETESFLQAAEFDGQADARAAAFRAGRASALPHAPLREAFGLLLAALGARPQPRQGLVISQRFYQQLGGHDAGGSDPERELLRRLGRRRITLLRSNAAMLGG
jgi:glycosyltransferase involved in cell wall biosynthesis